MKLFVQFVVFLSFSFAACPSGLYEDTCGNCWYAYCYNYSTHEVFYDIDEADCTGELIWVIPGDDNDIYFNNYCEGECPGNFLLDDCGHCWQGYCYSFFAPGLNGDPPHSVYYDLSLEECESYGFNYYGPDHPSSPHWNSNSENCNDGSSDTGGDDGDLDSTCDTCLESCISYVVNQYGYTEEAAQDWCTTTPDANYGCADSCENHTCVEGDVNNDSDINVSDIVEIVSFILQTSIPTDNQFCSADTNEDNLINIVDVVHIVGIILD
jgi:hypothetical protein